MPATPEKAETPGPDRDGDRDDHVVKVATPATPPPGMGVAVNKSA